MICWSCREPVQGPVCVGCGVVQPPPPKVDPFAIFGLERRYHVDLALAEERYRALARQVHPDRYTRKSAVERRMALQWTAAANEARVILRDPTKRAWWLATGSAAPREKGVKLDGAFLQEMFEWREEEEASPGSMRPHAEARAAAVEAELDAMFTAWEAGTADLGLIEDRLSRLKYLRGILEERHGEHRH